MVRNPDNCRSLPRVHGRGMLPTFEITNLHCVLTHNATAKHLRFDANKPAPILISDGEKGGIGKSHLERLLAYLMSAHSVQWQGFDLDPRNSHLARFHPKVDVRRLDWNDAAAWEDLYHGIMQVDKTKAVLIDLPAQCGPVVKNEYPRLLRTANHIGRTVLRFWTLTHEFDSVNLLAQSMSAIDCANTFAVLNLRNANRGDFHLWDSSRTREALLGAGGTELSMPRLPPAVANKIEAENLSFFDAASSLSEPWLQFDIEAYLSLVEAEFAAVIARLA